MLPGETRTIKFEALKEACRDEIKVYVDLNGLGEGRYTKELFVKGNNPLAIYKLKRTEATVDLIKKN